jgi:CRISPR/Cas system-associated protein Cas7 (RAMP superfamily)
MLMKMPVRSGVYAANVRYKSAGIGIDTDKWKVAITDEQQRLQRHKSILSALRDQLLSPSGALTSTILPHLTGIIGAIVVRRHQGEQLSTRRYRTTLSND